MDLLSTISYVLKDGAKQYTEHNGNVHFETITLVSYTHLDVYKRQVI